MYSSLVSPFSLLVIVILLQFSLSSAVTPEVLSDICSDARNPLFCVTAFNSNPKTATVDIKGLCQISIDLAHDNAVATYNMLGILAKLKTDPTLTDRYATCYKNYDEVIASLDQGKLKVGDPISAYDATTNIMQQVDLCLQRFMSPPADPSSLQTKNFNMIDLALMIKATAEYIPKHD